MISLRSLPFVICLALTSLAADSDTLGLPSTDVAEAIEFLDEYWNADEQVLIPSYNIAASLGLLERIAHRVELYQAKVIYKLAAKILSAVVRDVGNMRSWLISLKSSLERIPTRVEHYDLACHLCGSQFDHVRQLLPFLNIVSCLFLRFSTSQLKAFLEPQLTSLKYIPHMDVFCSHVPLSARLDLLKHIVSAIVDIRMSLFPNCKNAKLHFQWENHNDQLHRIGFLYDMASYMGLHADLIDFLLDVARHDRDRTREHHFVALVLISRNPQVIQSNYDLVFKLFSLPNSRFGSPCKYFKEIVENTPAHCFKLYDHDGESLLGAYYKFDEVDLPLFKKIESLSYPEVSDSVRLRELNSQNPDLQYWHYLFAESNLRSIRSIGCLDFFDLMFDSHKNRRLLEAMVLLDLFGKEDYRMELNTALAIRDAKFIVQNCRNAFSSFSTSLGHSIFHLIEHCNSSGRLEDVIYDILDMFSNPVASSWFIAHHADCIVLRSKMLRLSSSDRGLRVHCIGQIIASICSQMPGLCQAFVSLFMHYFRDDEALLSRANMSFDTSVASLYLLSYSAKQYVFKPALTVSELVFASFDISLKLYHTKDATYHIVLAQSIAAVALRLFLNPFDVDIASRFASKKMKQLPLNMLQKPFRAVWRERGFQKFSDILLENVGSLLGENSLLPPQCPLAIATVFEPNIGNRRIRARRIVNISDDYEIISQIGQGTFGTVYRARIADHFVAIKKMGLHDACAAAESEFMSIYCHSNQIPGLVQLFDIAHTDYDIYIVMELIEGQVLHNWEVPTESHQAAQELLKFVYQIALILHRLHGQNWMHGDLCHLGNFVIEQSSNLLVLVDFGFTQRTDGECGDGVQIYDRLMDLLWKYKRAFGCTWNQRAPRPLQAFEELLSKWKHHQLQCSEFLSDSIFDEFRGDLYRRATLQALTFPIQSSFESIDPSDVIAQRLVLQPSVRNGVGCKSQPCLQRQSGSIKEAFPENFAFVIEDLSAVVDCPRTANLAPKFVGSLEPETASTKDHLDALVPNCTDPPGNGLGIDAVIIEENPSESRPDILTIEKTLHPSSISNWEREGVLPVPIVTDSTETSSKRKAPTVVFENTSILEILHATQHCSRALSTDLKRKTLCSSNQASEIISTSQPVTGCIKKNRSERVCPSRPCDEQSVESRPISIAACNEAISARVAEKPCNDLIEPSELVRTIGDGSDAASAPGDCITTDHQPLCVAGAAARNNACELADAQPAVTNDAASTACVGTIDLERALAENTACRGPCLTPESKTADREHLAFLQSGPRHSSSTTQQELIAREAGSDATVQRHPHEIPGLFLPSSSSVLRKANREHPHQAVPFEGIDPAGRLSDPTLRNARRSDNVENDDAIDHHLTNGGYSPSRSACIAGCVPDDLYRTWPGAAIADSGLDAVSDHHQGYDDCSQPGPTVHIVSKTADAPLDFDQCALIDANAGEKAEIRDRALSERNIVTVNNDLFEENQESTDARNSISFKQDVPGNEIWDGSAPCQSSGSHYDFPDFCGFREDLTKHAFVITVSSLGLAVLSCLATVCMYCRRRNISRSQATSNIYPISA